MRALSRDHPAGRSRLVSGAGLAAIAVAFFLAGLLLAPAPGERAGAPGGFDRTELPRPQPVGAFSLTDLDGRPFGRERLLGRWTLLYFGYTHCPDVCEPSLRLVAGLAATLDDPHRGDRPVQAVFVTVDPARDTPAVLTRYLARTPGDLVGLRGSEAEVAELAAGLGILHLPRTPDSEGSYLVDHPATILVIDPDARLRAGYPFPHDAEWIAGRIAALVDRDG